MGGAEQSCQSKTNNGLEVRAPSTAGPCQSNVRTVRRLRVGRPNCGVLTHFVRRASSFGVPPEAAAERMTRGGGDARREPLACR